MTETTRRRFIASSAAAAVLAAPALARAQEIVLDFPSWQTDEPGAGDWWRQAIAAFQQSHPGVRVNLYMITFAQYVQQLTTRFAANNPPDIVHLPARNFASFAAQDWLQPVDDILAQTDVPRLWTPLQAEMEWDGKVRGLLLMGFGNVLFYNEKLLADAGVALPTEAEPWLAAMERLTRRDQGQFGFACTTIEHPQLLVDAATWTASQGLDWLEGGRYRFTEPRIVAALEQYRRAVRFAPPGQSAEASRQLFIDGKIAFMRDGPWVWAQLQRAPDAVKPHLKLGRVPLPQVAGGTSNSLHIATHTTGRKRELVAEFMKLVTTQPMQEQYTIRTGAPAPRRGAMSEAEAARYPHLRLANQLAEQARNMFPVVPAVRENYNEFARAVAQAAMRMISSNDPTPQILADLQRGLERQIPLR